MSDMPPLDQDLMRAFDEAHAPLLSEVFIEQLQERIVRARRARLALQVGALVLLAAVAVLVTPYVASFSRAVVDSMASPLSWACSLVAGVWALRRSHVFSR